MVVCRILNATEVMTRSNKLLFQPVYLIDKGNVLHNEIILDCPNRKNNLYSSESALSPAAKSNKQNAYYPLTQVIDLLSSKADLSLSLNLSYDVLHDTNFLNYIQDLLECSSVKPNRLSFEITEEIISRNYQASVILIKNLKKLGCSVILDDFSSQFLTVSQWAKLLIDVVKVAPQLIEKIKDTSSARSVVKFIVKISHSFGQLTVAKANNSIIAFDVIKTLGFNSIQGCYLKAPSPHISTNSKVSILNVPIDNVTTNELLSQLQTGVVYTPNVDHIIKLQKDESFFQVYNSADYKICDSQIIFYASKFVGMPIKEKISGSDFFPAFYNYHKNNEEIKIYLLGGANGVAQKAQATINNKIGRNIIVEAHSPSFGFENNKAECLEIINLIQKSKATVLAIGVGCPKQELWIYKYKDLLPNIKIFLAIGATIDFEAGNIKRAPKLISSLGFEWLYRLILEPQRLWKRYLVDDLPFIWLVLNQRVNQLLNALRERI